MVFSFIIIGIGSNLSDKAFILVCSTYSIGSFVLAIFSVNFYLGGFDLEASQFLIEGKNQLGALVAVGGAISFYLSQYTKRKFGQLYLLLAVLIFLVLLVIRCRTALVAYVLFVMIYVWQFWSHKSKMYFFILLTIIGAFYFDTIIDIVNTVLFNNDEIGDVDSLTTGRYERNIKGIAYFSNHMFTGELLENSEIEWIHNYLLLRFVKYGIWALPFLAIYLLFFVTMVKSFLKKEYNLKAMGIYVLTIPFFCSMLEPSAPFGPGTVQIMSYLLFGIYLGHNWH